MSWVCNKFFTKSFLNFKPRQRFNVAIFKNNPKFWPGNIWTDLSISDFVDLWIYIMTCTILLKSRVKCIDAKGILSRKSKFKAAWDKGSVSCYITLYILPKELSCVLLWPPLFCSDGSLTGQFKIFHFVTGLRCCFWLPKSLCQID